MEWTWMHSAYLFFAVAHPVSELIRGIDLRTFLNLDYYQTGQKDFPVSQEKGVKGSLFVLVVLILPLVAVLFSKGFLAVWCLAFGLAVADLVQHLTHFALGRRRRAALVHLITILGVCFFLWRIAPKMDELAKFGYHWVILALLIGALIIFWNWWRNSSNVRKGASVARGQGLSLQS